MGAMGGQAQSCMSGYVLWKGGGYPRLVLQSMGGRYERTVQKTGPWVGAMEVEQAGEKVMRVGMICNPLPAFPLTLFVGRWQGKLQIVIM